MATLEVVLETSICGKLVVLPIARRVRSMQPHAGGRLHVERKNAAATRAEVNVV
jgi:hypothetical protein